MSKEHLKRVQRPSLSVEFISRKNGSLYQCPQWEGISSYKLLIIKGLRRPGPRKSLIINDLR